MGFRTFNLRQRSQFGFNGNYSTTSLYRCGRPPIYPYRTKIAPAESSRQSMSTSLMETLPAGCVGATLTEVDAYTKEPRRLRDSTLNIGPFSAFSLSAPAASNQSGTLGQSHEPDIPTDFPSVSISDADSILDIENFLGWNDIFNTGFDFAAAGSSDQVYEDPLTMLARVANEPSDFQPSSSVSESRIDPGAVIENEGAPPVLEEMSDAKVLSHGEILLQYFKHAVIPTYAPLPMASKSPWEILNCYAAVQTFADMTYLGVRDVKHASKANLFGILACAAFTIAKSSSDIIQLSASKCERIGEYAGRRAKEHLQETLRSETSGAQKAKYKDQLMAINTLIALATLVENQHDARCYLIDAERLLRLRGLAKKVLSRRARLLHHVYTWMRIVGESTFIIHDYANSTLLPRIEASLSRSRNLSNRMGKDADAPNVTHGHLDDFLRVEGNERDSETDAEEQKDREVGIRDIHLEDMRQFSDTLYLQIYGIPETWLSLVSRTTRLANVLDVINASEKEVSRALHSFLQRKSSMLESVVCSTASANMGPPPESTESSIDDPGIETTAATSNAMLRAMNAALVIFFYRRIRNVHPWILRTYVSDVIEGLKDFDRGVALNSSYRSGTLGTIWPAFIAGCEAMTESSRNWLCTWLEKSSNFAPAKGNSSIVRILQTVWHKRDAMAGTESRKESGQKSRSRSQKRADTNYTWVHVLRDERFWPMLY
ncbi:MAG: hypothetical protein Q9223_001919 [Gallowayella weberi]